MRRRRYDTAALIDDLRKERRNFVLLTLAGTTVLVLALLFYIVEIGDSEELQPSRKKGPKHQVAADKAVEQPSSSDAAPPIEEEQAPEPEPESEAEVQPSAATRRALVEVALPRKAALWIDGRSLGKQRRHKTRLPPGRHRVKARIRKKTYSARLDVEAGRGYVVRFDAKRRKLVVRTK